MSSEYKYKYKYIRFFCWSKQTDPDANELNRKREASSFKIQNKTKSWSPIIYAQIANKTQLFNKPKGPKLDAYSLKSFVIWKWLSQLLPINIQQLQRMCYDSAAFKLEEKWQTENKIFIPAEMLLKKLVITNFQFLDTDWEICYHWKGTAKRKTGKR